MQRLHHYLDEGYGAEKALVLAKRDLLKNQSLGVRYHAPSYWANFIYTGKLQDHHRPHNGFKTVGWILAGVTLLFAGMRLRKKKAPSS
jgi:hypothetical protein